MFQQLFGRSRVQEVTAQEAKARLKAGAIIVDVREPHEWSEGHIPGALHIPLGSLARHVGELDSAKEVIAVCRSGNRSISAALILQRAGFTRASSMSGGMISWMRNRFPTTRA
ncbi:MAG TPA: rhodanese-like domain-containing protein [Ktedonobacteraceae bacterium]|nr:rhodanese-like domain-containing protein [Ktedonobacteraceae bacterium]